MKEFGERDPTASYVVRPGAYAVMQDREGRIGIVVTPTGAFLPGGGQDPGESLEQTLIREVREECALDVVVIEELGSAIQLVYSAREETHFQKECTFFRVAIAATLEADSEPDHELHWVEPAQAIEMLAHASNIRAVEQWALPLRSS